MNPLLSAMSRFVRGRRSGRGPSRRTTDTRKRGRERPRLQLREDRTLFSITIAATTNNGNGYAGLDFNQTEGACRRHASRKKYLARVSPGAVGLRIDRWKSDT